MSTVRVANAPCSWGTLEFEEFDGEQVPYDRMLDELVETGYVGTELGDWGYMPKRPGRLREELRQRGLTMTGAFVPVALKDPSQHRDGVDHAVRVAELLAAVAGVGDPDHDPYLVLSDENGRDWQRQQYAGRVTDSMGLTDSQWETFSKGAEKIARAVREETGLSTVFHHHCGGYVETPGEIEELLARTDPDLIGLVLDTGHYAYGAGVDGCDRVTEGLDRFDERIEYLHFKDLDLEIAQQARVEGWGYFDAVKEGLFCPLGDGCVDFPAVVQWTRDHYRGWVVVEQDILPEMGEPAIHALENREYLASIGL